MFSFSRVLSSAAILSLAALPSVSAQYSLTEAPFFRNTFSGQVAPDTVSLVNGAVCQTGNTLTIDRYNVNGVGYGNSNYILPHAFVSTNGGAYQDLNDARYTGANVGVYAIHADYSTSYDVYNFNPATLPTLNFEVQLQDSSNNNAVVATSPVLNNGLTCDLTNYQPILFTEEPYFRNPESGLLQEDTVVLADGSVCQNGGTIEVHTSGVTPNNYQQLQPVLVDATTGAVISTAQCAYPSAYAQVYKVNCYYTVDAQNAVYHKSPTYNVQVDLLYSGRPIAKSNVFTFSPTCQYPAKAIGDPQFTGFMGQSYQVHGASDAFYNILSTPQLSYNAHFAYLESGSCRKGTACFSHAGNYFSEVALMIRDQDNKVNGVKVVAGPVATGLSVVINGAPLAIGSSAAVGAYEFTLESAFDVVVASNEFNLRISNSDMFVNQDVAIGTELMQQIGSLKAAAKTNNATAVAEIEATLPHGILGQTWSTRTYANRWKHIAGQLFDYQLDSIESTEFKFSRF